jgi:hypothetical protein
MVRPYEQATAAQWRAYDLPRHLEVDQERFAWSTATRFGGFGAGADLSGTSFEQWGRAEWAQLSIEAHNWLLSQFLHGEQAALVCVGVPDAYPCPTSSPSASNGGSERRKVESTWRRAPIDARADRIRTRQGARESAMGRSCKGLRCNDLTTCDGYAVVIGWWRTVGRRRRRKHAGQSTLSAAGLEAPWRPDRSIPNAPQECGLSVVCTVLTTGAATSGKPPVTWDLLGVGWGRFELPTSASRRRSRRRRRGA